MKIIEDVPNAYIFAFHISLVGFFKQTMKNILVFCSVIFLIYIIFQVFIYQTVDEGLNTLHKNGAVILDITTEKDY